MAYKNKEDKQEYLRGYYLRNRDWLLARQKERAAFNKEEKAAYDKQYRIENEEKVKASKRKYRQNNLKDIAKLKKEWQKTDVYREYQRVYQSKRRATIRVRGEFTKTDIRDMYATQGGRCYYCSVDIEGGYHIEHMTPLSRGGTNGVSNICLACAPCNMSKRMKTAEEFQRVS